MSNLGELAADPPWGFPAVDGPWAYCIIRGRVTKSSKTIMTTAKTVKIRSIADGLGVLGSLTCAAHCLLLPALLVAGSSIPSLLGSEKIFHWMLTGIVIPCAFFAFFIGCKKHRDRWVFALGGIGLATLILIAITGHEVLGEFWERVLMAASSGMLISAHLRNFLLCQRS